MTYLETQVEAQLGVADQLVGQLPWNGYDNNVSRITENVLRAFMRGSADPVPEGEAGHQVEG